MLSESARLREQIRLQAEFGPLLLLGLDYAPRPHRARRGRHRPAKAREAAGDLLSGSTVPLLAAKHHIERGGVLDAPAPPHDVAIAVGEVFAGVFDQLVAWRAPVQAGDRRLPETRPAEINQVVASLVLPRLTEPEPLLVGAGFIADGDRARPRRALRVVAGPARTRTGWPRLDDRADAPRPDDPRLHRVPARLPSTQDGCRIHDRQARARHRPVRRPPARATTS